MLALHLAVYADVIDIFSFYMHSVYLKLPYSYFLFSFHLLLAGHVQTIDSFVSESLEILSNRPESMEEISEANTKYNQILAQKNDVS